MRNPYLNRVAIKDTTQFYGRRKEAARIFSRIGASRPQSVAIVGGRKIGKSSLLNYIYAPEVRSRMLDGNEYLFVFMDLQQKRFQSMEGFFADLILGVGDALAEAGAEPIEVKGSDFDGVRRLFTQLHRRKHKLICLLDEFDVITSNRAFNLDFFAFLRSAANNYDVAYITSSASDLQELCHTDQIADSPFFNIFTNIYLRPFSPEEARELIAEPSRQAGLPLEDYRQQILELAGYFPFFLQIACANFFDHLLEYNTVSDIKKIEEGFLDEARVHFRYIWEHLHEEEREVIDSFLSGLGIPKSKEHIFEELRRSGYFVDDRLFSRLFGSVVTDPRYPAMRQHESEEYIPPTDPVLNREETKRSRFLRDKDDSEPGAAPRQLDRFQIIDRLGQGGMGEVFLARDSELRRQVAIKLLRRRYASDETIRRRFLREAQTASMLSHPNIATIYEIGESAGVPYIVMEFVRGATLTERLCQRPFTLAEVVDVGLQVSSALAEAHNAGIIHRDIKSSNVLIDERGRVKVLDFGLAKPSLFDRDDEERSFDITEPGILLGTVNYMSPEQAQGQDLDARSDIFSLGVVLYEIATGRLPFDGETYFQIIEAVTKLQPTPIGTLRPDAPGRLIEIINKMLEKDPQNRFQTAGSLHASLESLKTLTL